MYADTTRLKDSQQRHERLLNAIERGDAESVERSMRNLLTNIWRKETLDSEAETTPVADDAPQKGGKKIAVMFEVTPTTEGKDDYFKLGAALKEQLMKVPGFISVERFASVNTEGKFLSLSFWESEDAVRLWRNNLAHRQGQKKGHDALFDNYRISVGTIVREYTDKRRDEAPTDSNDYICND